MSSPDPVKTVKEIKTYLDSQGGDWLQLPRMYALHNVDSEQIASDGKVDFNHPKGGTVLIAFLNLQNSEVRFFIAKYLNTPDRDKLWGGDR